MSKIFAGIDLLPGLACFLVGLFSELDYGIFAGVGLHLVIVLYHVARPKVRVEVQQTERSGQEFLLITPDQGIIFPSVSFIRTLISKAGAKEVIIPKNALILKIFLILDKFFFKRKTSYIYIYFYIYCEIF